MILLELVSFDELHSLVPVAALGAHVDLCLSKVVATSLHIALVHLRLLRLLDIVRLLRLLLMHHFFLEKIDELCLR